RSRGVQAASMDGEASHLPCSARSIASSLTGARSRPLSRLRSRAGRPASIFLDILFAVWRIGRSQAAHPEAAPPSACPTPVSPSFHNRRGGADMRTCAQVIGLVSLAALGGLVACGRTTPEATPATAPQSRSSDAEWAMPNKNMASTRYSTLAEINGGNVKNLKVAWTFSTG